MLGLLLLVGASSSPTFAAAVALNQAEWLTADNYPTRAAYQGKSGSTQADIFIDTAGRPRACYVVRSSGSKDLDGQSCAAAIHRGRFTPAHDAAGEPMNGIYSFVTRWRVEDGIDNMLTSLPGRSRATEPADVTLTVGKLPVGRSPVTLALNYIVDQTGVITGCAIERSSGFPALDRAACAAMPTRYRFAPARDQSGKAWPVVRTQLVAFEAAAGPG